jgi:predicted PurR-regulated permease PerM
MVVVFLLIPSILIVVVFTNQLIQLYPIFIEHISKAENVESFIKSFPVISSLYEKLEKFTANFNLDLHSTLKNLVAIVLDFLVSQGKNIFINFTLILIGIAFISITVFFLFKDGHLLYKRIYSLIPLPEKEKNYIIQSSYNAIQGVVLGSVFTAIAQGILSFIGYYFAGVNFALFWAILTFFVAFFPIGGAALVWVPIAIYIFFTKGVIAGILFSLWGTFVISTVDNIIKPIVIGEKTNLHPIVFVFAILGGLNLFGFVGLFIAPIIVVVIDNLLNIYKERYVQGA